MRFGYDRRIEDLPPLSLRLALCCLALHGVGLLLAGPAAAQPARSVYVGVYLRDVSTLDQRHGVFDVDLDLWAKWRGEMDPTAITIANAAEVTQELAGEEADGSWHAVRWRVRGTLRGEFPLHRFPFDKQTLPIVLELPAHQGTLRPDLASSSMAERFSVTDWEYQPVFRPARSERRLPSDLGHLRHESHPTTLHRVAFQVSLQRPLAPVVLKLFVPLLIILLVAIASLFVHPEQVEARAGMGVTALLSCFAFQFTVSDTLPAVTYVTLADTLFLIGYVVSGFAVVITIITAGLVRRGRERAALDVDRGARFLLPLGGLLAALVAVPAEPAVSEDEPEPVPEMARERSAVDTLSLGSNLLSTVGASPLAFAAEWDLIHQDPLDGRQVVYVERAPGVDTEAMHLLAGGQMVVTWTLRESARWSDGEPLTSADLAFAHEIAPDPDIERVEMPDERTYVVRWRHAVAHALDAPGATPEHALRQAFDEGGYGGVREHRRAHTYPTLGPYRYASWDGERLVIEANPHFPGAPPNIPRIELVRYERDALAAAFEAGEIDMTVPNAITPEAARALEQRRPEAVVHQPSALFIHADLDFDNEALADAQVRRALLAAIDRERLARDVYADAGRVAHTPIPGAPPEGLEPVAHDPPAARAILEPLGLTLPLHVTDSSVDQAIAARMAEDFAAAGVEVELRVVPSTLRVARDGGHGGIVLAILRGRRDAAPERYWNVPIVDGRYDPDHRNPAYTDAVHELARREARALYPERRDQLRDALFIEYGRRLPSLPLIFAAERVLVRPDLRGWRMPPDTPFGVGMERWWVERGERTTASRASSPAASRPR